MASPQLKNGHVRIANEYFDRLLLADLGRREFKVILAVIRETWGWGKKTAMISHSRLGRMTGVHRSHVAAALQELIRRRLLHRTKSGELGPQKDYDTWLSMNGSTCLPGTNRSMLQTVPRYESAPSPATNRLHPPVRTVAASKTTTSRKGSAEARASGPHQAILQEYDRLFAEKFEKRPVIVGGRDGKIVSDLVKTRSAEEILDLLRGFFRVGTKFSRERGAYTLPAFKSQYNDLLVMKQRGEL